jgi:uncharacterized membrane protein (DUF106 family)
MTSFVPVLTSLPWFAWIAIVAIVSGMIGGVVKTMIIHRERMAMIRQGMHPDSVASVTSKPYCEQTEV